MLRLASTQVDHSSLPSKLQLSSANPSDPDLFNPCSWKPWNGSSPRCIAGRWPLRLALVATGDRKALPVQHASSNWLFQHSRLPGRRRLKLSIAYDTAQQADCLTAAASPITAAPSCSSCLTAAASPITAAPSGSSSSCRVKDTQIWYH